MITLHGQYVQALKTRLSEAVGEARAFAQQQKADAERTKRTYSQVTVGLMSDMPYAHATGNKMFLVTREAGTARCDLKGESYYCRQICSRLTRMWR